jgi:hypothetical protein
VRGEVGVSDCVLEDEPEVAAGVEEVEGVRG